MSIAYAWGLLRRRLGMLVVIGVLCSAGAYGVVSSAATYRVTAHVVLEPTPRTTAMRAVDPERFLSTQGQRMLSGEVLEMAVDSLARGTTVAQLRESISLRNAPGSDVLEVSVVGGDAKTAERRGIAVVESFGKQSTAQVTARVLWVDGPSVNFSPLRAAVLGGSAGTALAALLTLIVGLVRRPVLSPADVELSSEAAAVYPSVLPPRWAEQPHVRASYVRLLAWLSAFAGQHNAEIVVVPVGESPPQGFAHALDSILDGRGAPTTDEGVATGGDVVVADASSMLRPSRGGGFRRVVVFVAQQETTTERQIDTTINGLVPPDEACAVVVLGRRPA